MTLIGLGAIPMLCVTRNTVRKHRRGPRHFVTLDRRRARPTGVIACRVVMRRSRTIDIEVERDTEDILPQVSSSWLDQLMDAQAEGILLTGVERSEAVPSSDSLRYLYFPEMRLGPYRAIVRMTCRLGEQTTGNVQLDILHFNIGLVDPATNQVEYREDPKDVIEARATVSMEWSDLPQSEGVRLQQRAVQTFSLKVPWWFPVSTAAIEAILRRFITSAINSGHRSVVDALKQQAVKANTTKVALTVDESSLQPSVARAVD